MVCALAARIDVASPTHPLRASPDCAGARGGDRRLPAGLVGGARWVDADGLAGLGCRPDQLRVSVDADPGEWAARRSGRGLRLAALASTGTRAPSVSTSRCHPRRRPRCSRLRLRRRRRHLGGHVPVGARADGAGLRRRDRCRRASGRLRRSTPARQPGDRRCRPTLLRSVSLALAGVRDPRRDRWARRCLRGCLRGDRGRLRGGLPDGRGSPPRGGARPVVGAPSPGAEAGRRCRRRFGGGDRARLRRGRRVRPVGRRRGAGVRPRA